MHLRGLSWKCNSKIFSKDGLIKVVSNFVSEQRVSIGQFKLSNSPIIGLYLAYTSLPTIITSNTICTLLHK